MRLEALKQKITMLKQLEQEVLTEIQVLYPFENDVDEYLNEHFQISGQFPKDISLEDSYNYYQGDITSGDNPLWGILREVYDGKYSVATMAGKLVEVHPDDW